MRCTVTRVARCVKDSFCSEQCKIEFNRFDYVTRILDKVQNIYKHRILQFLSSLYPSESLNRLGNLSVSKDRLRVTHPLSARAVTRARGMSHCVKDLFCDKNAVSHL